MDSHDLIISATQINHHHGVGILLQRLFPHSADLVTLRSLTVYEDEETFGIGHHELKSMYLTLQETETQLQAILARYRIRRILCVPFYREDFIHAFLAQKLTKAPLCTYIMDDQNIFSNKVPDYWVDRLLRSSDLCLGISPELCAAYQHKYNHKLHLLPPLVERAEPLVPCSWQPGSPVPLKVAMIGNVWTVDRFQKLRSLLRTAGLQVDWYGTGPAAGWLRGTREEWEADNIHCLGYLPEDELITALAAYPCVLVPSGSLDQEDDNLSFSRLSLPSRLIFLHTRTDTPVLLLGSKDSAAGRFILNLGTGLCASYQAEDLRQQLAKLQEPVEHQRLRQAIRRWAPQLVLTHGGQRLWDSLARREPVQAAFLTAFQASVDNAIWLKQLSRAQPKPEQPVIPTNGELPDKTMEAFAFLRTTHAPLLASAGMPTPEIKDFELNRVLEKLTGVLVQNKMPNGGNLLLLSTDIPSWAAELPPNIKGWRIRDFEAWQQAGFPGEASHLASLAGDIPYPSSKVTFEAIVSQTWPEKLKGTEAITRIATCLTALTRPGGFNLHAFTARLHPDFFWTEPAYNYLRAERQLPHWAGLDEILSAPDTFFMSEAAYAKFWQPSTGKPYHEFGKTLGLFLFWRRELLLSTNSLPPNPC